MTDDQKIAIQECIDYLIPAAKAFADLDLGDSKHARCIRTLRALLSTGTVSEDMYLGRIDRPEGGEAWVELTKNESLNWPDTVRVVQQA